MGGGEVEGVELFGVLHTSHKRAHLVAEAEREIAAFEGAGDPTSLLTTEELAAAAARKPFVEDAVWNGSDEQLAARLREVLRSGDRVGQFVHWRAAVARSDALGRPQDLEPILDELRDAVAGPARLERIGRARETLREAMSVELLAGNLKSGSTSAGGSWLNRRFGAA